jgi:hypothetical protein
MKQRGWLNKIQVRILLCCVYNGAVLKGSIYYLHSWKLRKLSKIEHAGSWESTQASTTILDKKGAKQQFITSKYNFKTCLPQRCPLPPLSIFCQVIWPRIHPSTLILWKGGWNNLCPGLYEFEFEWEQLRSFPIQYYLF